MVDIGGRIFEIVAMIGACATVYAAIRADLAAAIAKAEMAAASATRAHERIDDILNH
jgi:hypothetical protein